MALGVALAPWAVPWAAEREGIRGIAWPGLGAAAPAVLAALALVLATRQAWRMRERPVLFVHAVAAFVLLAGAFLHVALLPIADPVKSFARAASRWRPRRGAVPSSTPASGRGPTCSGASTATTSPRSPTPGRWRERFDGTHGALFARRAGGTEPPSSSRIPGSAWTRTWEGTVGHKRFVVIRRHP